MSKVEEIKTIYQVYLENKEDEERKASALSKLEKLIMSKGPDNKLEAFNSAVKEFVEDMIMENPSNGETSEVVDFILSAPAVYKNGFIPEIILVAVFGNAVQLVPFLNREDAAVLCSKHFPKVGKHFDYPVKKEIYKALKSAMK